jgi:hypothetical protein
VDSSDRQSGFGEGCLETQLWRGVGGEFVVASAEVLDESVTAGAHGGGPKTFQSAHRRKSGLLPTMIGFDTVIAVPLGDVRGRHEVIDDPQVWGGLVGGDFDRDWAMSQRPG